MVGKIDKKQNWKWLFIGISFSLLFFMLTYKLTNASLWFDETIEFYYSKTFFGTLPWDDLLDTMYKRIISTFQPPLYNFLMYFWLKISTTEYWFRFFGVITDMVCGAGVYKSIEKIWNGKAAAISIIVLGCTKNFIYYCQECAEYTLLLAGLAWFIYAWLCIIEKVTIKRLIGYLIAATISVYSQYGAVFPVVAFSVVLLIYVLINKNKNDFLRILSGFGLTILVAALPLWIFFVKKQINRQQANTNHKFVFSGNIIKDFYHQLKTILGWCFTYNNKGIIIVSCIIIILVFLFSSQKMIKYLILANILCFLLYYLAVKLSFYSYGEFGSRYNLFFIPVWIICAPIILGEMYNLWIPTAQNFTESKIGVFILERRFLYLGICVAIAFIYCSAQWDTTLKYNWQKEDIRDATAAWYDEKAYNGNTLVYYYACAGFYYYLEHNSAYNSAYMNNITFMDYCRNESEDEYIEYLNELYKDKWPEELYFIASHTVNDVDTIIQCFTDSGYTAQDIFNSYGGRLVHLVNENNAN